MFLTVLRILTICDVGVDMLFSVRALLTCDKLKKKQIDHKASSPIFSFNLLLKVTDDVGVANFYHYLVPIFTTN